MRSCQPRANIAPHARSRARASFRPLLPNYDGSPAGDYWLMRNSWGEFWGEMGYARVAKGKNALLLESNCAWAVR